MRTRQLRILQMGLAIAAGLLAWRLAAEWQRANLRYSTLSRANTERPAAVLPNPARREPPPAQEIVAQNLFSPDRNNEIAQAVKSEPLPPVPVVFGTMKLGENYEALMVEGGPSAGRSPRRVKSGEHLGPYIVVDIRDEKVVIEYGGQKTTLDVYQSAHSVLQSAARTAPTAPAPPVVETGASAPPAAPVASQPASAPAGAGAGQQPSSTPGVRGFDEGNRLRFEKDSPFGTQIWYGQK